MRVRAKLVIEIVGEFNDDKGNDAETLRYCVEDDLEDIGYQVDNCEVIEGTEEIEFDGE